MKKKIKGKINNEISFYEENNINSKNKNYNELSNKKHIKEEYNRKDENSKSKTKKINYKINKNKKLMLYWKKDLKMAYHHQENGWQFINHKKLFNQIENNTSTIEYKKLEIKKILLLVKSR